MAVRSACWRPWRIRPRRRSRSSNSAWLAVASSAATVGTLRMVPAIVPPSGYRSGVGKGRGSAKKRERKAVDPEDVRLAIYGHLAKTGRAPATAALAEHFRVSTRDVKRTLGALAAARHLVLDDHDHVVMAHPFATVP